MGPLCLRAKRLETYIHVTIVAVELPMAPLLPHSLAKVS